MRFVNYTKATGRSTSVAQARLIDANANFLGGGGLPVVQAGDIVEREEANYDWAVVQQVLSGTELVLSKHIFTQVHQRYRIRAGFVLVEGVTTGHESGKLIDSTKNFPSLGVRSGFTVYSGGEVATVISVDGPSSLSLSRPIILGVGQRYWVYPGEWIYAESLEITARGTKRLLGADSTPVTVAASGPVKELPFFCHEKGLLVKKLFVLVEVSATASGGSLSLLVDSSPLASAPVPPGTSLLVLEANVDLAPGKHTAQLAASPPQNGNLSLGLTEFYAKEVMD